MPKAYVRISNSLIFEFLEKVSRGYVTEPEFRPTGEDPQIDFTDGPSYLVPVESDSAKEGEILIVTITPKNPTFLDLERIANRVREVDGYELEYRTHESFDYIDVPKTLENIADMIMSCAESNEL